MNHRRFLHITFSLIIAVSLMLGGSSKVTAMPMNPADETKVPHYFGPNPNWANSPFTLPDAQVVITGNGTGATAEATVGAGGAITAITVTNGGQGYSSAKIDIFGSGTGAMAKATIVKKGSVVAVTVDTPGTGYTAPTVTFSGNGGAAATAYGGVEQVTVIQGTGYTMPTVDFDLPDGEDGVHAVQDGEVVHQLRVDLSQDRHDTALHPLDQVVLEAQLADLHLYTEDLAFGGTGLHDYDHCLLLLGGNTNCRQPSRAGGPGPPSSRRGRSLRPASPC